MLNILTHFCNQQKNLRYLKWLQWLIAILIFSLVLSGIRNITAYFAKPNESNLSFSKIEPLGQIVAAHWFGLAPALVNYDLLPLTTLPVVLVGTNVSYNKSESSAIITVSGQQQVIEAGDSILGAEVVAILPNRVVIYHQNRLEAIALPEPALDFSAPPPSLDLPAK